MLSRRMQIQAVADMLARLPTRRRYRLAEFEDPWLHCYRALLDASSAEAPHQARDALMFALANRSDRDSIIGAIVAAVPGCGPSSVPDFSDVVAGIPSVAWLWPGWLPIGAITLLGAAAGTGKSYLALDLAYRVITGAPFPGGPPEAEVLPGPGPRGQVAEGTRGPAEVLYVDAERCEQMLKDRFLAWPDRPRGLHVLEPPLNDIFDLTRQEYRDALIDAVDAHAPRLVIVDSLSGISSRGENSIEDVRQIMAFLTALAAEGGCALLLLHHLRKMLLQSFRDELSQDDFRGSTHLTAAPRCVLGLSLVQTGSEPNRNGPRKLEVVKTNFGRYPEPLGVEFVPLEPSGVELRYGPVPAKYREPTRGDDCARWLLETLSAAAQPMRPHDLVQLARAQGYSRTMLYRAREELAGQVINLGPSHSPTSQWSLAANAGTEDAA